MANHEVKITTQDAMRALHQMGTGEGKDVSMAMRYTAQSGRGMVASCVYFDVYEGNRKTALRIALDMSGTWSVQAAVDL